MLGMIDLHSHHLPALDDGPKKLEDSITQVKKLGAAGYRMLVATPHVIEGHFEYGRDELLHRVEALQRAAGDGAPELRIGAEHRFDGRFLELLEKKDVVTLGDAGLTVLLEFAWPKLPATILDVLYRVQLKGYTVLMAHPDRYDNDEGDYDRIAEWVDRGGLLQIELGSLVGAYGQRSEGAARRFLKDELVHVVAGDVHKPADVDVLAAPGLAALERTVGAERARRLAVTNPAELVGVAA